jgi:hypothetical protein
MNFEDVDYAVSTFFTLYVAISFLVNFLIPMKMGPEPGWFISGIIPAIVVGFIFGGKMAVAKLTSIGKILVLTTALFGLFLPTILGFMDWNNYITGNPSSTIQPQDFWLFMRNNLFSFITINLVPLLLTLVPGLYAGLSLRKASHFRL